MRLAEVELEKRYFRGVGRRVHLHVREQGRFNQRYALICRDYLRCHPLAADAYLQVKRQLARHFLDDVGAYYDVKDPVFDVLMAGAFDWAEAGGWAQGASDA